MSGPYTSICSFKTGRNASQICSKISRLPGKHETAAIDEFKYGISDRGASIRIPIGTVEKGWKGWLEDRRPNSAADPYKVAARIIKTVKSAALGFKMVDLGREELVA